MRLMLNTVQDARQMVHRQPVLLTLLGITQRSVSLARVLMANAALIVVALAGSGMARTFWLAVGLYWLVGVLRGVRWPLHSAWFNQRIDDSQVRATMFSVGSRSMPSARWPAGRSSALSATLRSGRRWLPRR